MPGEEFLPIDIADKVDSPEMAAYLAAYGATMKLSADEFNRIIKGVNRLYEIFQDNGGAVPDASTTIRGLIKLAGDLGGTADEPVIVKFSQLEITGTEPRALMLNPDKTPSTDSIMEFEAYDEAGPYTTLAEIQAAYPSEVSGVLKRPQGFQVWCVATTPVVMYKKYGDSDALWIMNDGSGWVKMT